MLKPSRIFHIIMSATALAWASYATNEIRLTQITILITFFWILGIFNRWEKSSKLSAISFAIIGLVGLFREIPFGWILSGLLLDYLAYDLSKFANRIRFASIGNEDNIPLITRVHLSRVALMTLLGLSISTAILISQNQLDIYWGIFLGIIFICWAGMMMLERKLSLKR